MRTRASILALSSFIMVMMVKDLHRAGAEEYAYIPKNSFMMDAVSVLTYYRMEDNLNWNEADYLCRTMLADYGGHLAKVDNAEATRRLKEIVSEDAWIGLYWKDSLGTAWADVKCMDFYQGEFTYDDYRDGEDAYHSNELCYLTRRDTGQWETKPCDTDQKAFVCEHYNVSGTCETAAGRQLFRPVNANFYMVDEAGANTEVCEAMCVDVMSCFLTMAGNDKCLMGVVDNGAVSSVRSRCYSVRSEFIATESIVYNVVKSNTPVICENVNTTALEERLRGLAKSDIILGGITTCENTTVTTTSVVLETSTTTFYETSTHVSKTVDVVTTTTYHSECATDTFIQPTTVTHTETMATSCTPTVCPSQVIQPSSTVTIETCSVTPTTTVRDCYMTSSCVVTQTVTHELSTMVPEPCSRSIAPNLTVKQVDELTSSIVEELIVNDDTLSTTRRKKESAYDARTSAQISGYAAIIFIVSTFAVLIIPDLPTLYNHIRHSAEIFK